MISQRQLHRIARTIIRVNLAVREGDLVAINAGPRSLDFAEWLAYEAAMVGGQPSIFYGSDRLNLLVYRGIKTRFLKDEPKLASILCKKTDVEITIDEEYPFIARKLPQRKIEIRRKALKRSLAIEQKRHLKRKMRSALIGFPTPQDSRAMNIPFKKLSKIFWGALNVDYEEIYRFNKKLLEKLSHADKIRIVGEKTNIELSVKRRKFFNSSGLVTKQEEIGYVDLPDGEIFTSPIEKSVNGEIYFDLPCVYFYGKQVRGVWFKFVKGRLVDYKIDKGFRDFEEVYKNASGNKDMVAELGIGTNPRARITGGMIIVDEKVRGTIHMAIGNNKHFGGKNEATIHWDFFKDMTKKGSRLYVDGKIFIKDGKFV